MKECLEDSKRIAQPPGFSFTEIAEIEYIIAPCVLDVIGVILEAGSTEQIVTRDEQLRDKRTLTSGDESNSCIEMTLWGEMCDLEFQEGQVVAFQNCRVSNFSGKSLNASWDINDVVQKCKHPRFHQVKNWIGKRDLATVKASITSLSKAFTKDAVYTL